MKNAIYAFCALHICCASTSAQQAVPPKIDVPSAPINLGNRIPTLLDAGANDFLGIQSVREEHKLSGKGLAVAVVDSGLNLYHPDFEGADKVPIKRSFCHDGEENIDDEYGHGSVVASIIAANESSSFRTRGVCPGAQIIPLKVFQGATAEENRGTVASDIINALKWILANHSQYSISVVNLSLGDKQKLISDEGLKTQWELEVSNLIHQLSQRRVAVVVAAGNWYHLEPLPDSENMPFPAICRDAISVGAIYHVDQSYLKKYDDGSHAKRAIARRCTPFTQRLSLKEGSRCYTTIFAPGFNLIGAGKVQFRDGTVDPIASAVDNYSAPKDGTSESAPVISGLVLLMQEYYKRNHNNELPSVEVLKAALWSGGIEFTDAEDKAGEEMDDVVSCGKTFRYANAPGAFRYLIDPKSTQQVTAPNLSEAQKDAARFYTHAVAQLSASGADRNPIKVGRVFFHVVNDEQCKIALAVQALLPGPKPGIHLRKDRGTSPDDMIEVRYLAEKDALAAGLIVKLFQDSVSIDGKPRRIKNVRPSYTLRSDPPEEAGDIEVWFPKTRPEMQYRDP